MKLITTGILLLFFICTGFAQQSYSDSLKHLVNSVKEDSDKVAALTSLSTYYSNLYPDSGVYYSDKIIELANHKNDRYAEILGLLSRGSSVLKQGDFAAAIQMAYKSLNLSKELNQYRAEMLSRSYQFIGEIYSVNNGPQQAVNYLKKSIDLQKQAGYSREDFYSVYFSLAFAMLIQEKMDSALYYVTKGQELFSSAKNKRNIQPWIVLGNVYRFSGNPQKGEAFYRKGIELGKQYNSLFFVSAISNDMAGLFLDKGLRDSCLKYAHQCLSLSRQYHFKVFEMYSSGLLSYFYDSVNTDSTLKYLKINVAVRDEILNDEKVRQFQSASFEEEKKETELETARAKYNTQLKMYAVIGAALLLLIAAVIFYRSNRHKQKANNLLKEEKEKVEETLLKLKSTQALLIQSEKMASLGELTAGIAHEIQNPLNFVNNFSEVNKELLLELIEEIKKGNIDEVTTIANDVIDNQEKINFHGKRADAIVKGMLQHSRSSSSIKEPTDINALCDEYLRLSYHGLRAKDKSFNAVPVNIGIKTDFDNSIGKINIVPQDIGRVLLNLLNNAFYAVNERQKEEGGNIKPLVIIQTKKQADKIEIIVRDNGNGILQNIIDKIFQPFFTTKPTGQGTGLGLSLAYDIIKAHGGELKVTTLPTGQAGGQKGTEFTIQLPL